VLVYGVIDDSISPSSFWAVLEVSIRREDAQRLIEEIRSDDPELARQLRIEERELESGCLY
jgi:hypothetical protein